ncbi:MAG: hypothetical protein AAGC72_15190 [Planctomycetota bacterium]
MQRLLVSIAIASSASLLYGVAVAAGDTHQIGGFDIIPLGLTGDDYTDSVAGGYSYDSRADSPYTQPGTRFIAGQTVRSTSAGGGYDAWLFDGATTRQIGLSGSDYEQASTDGRVWRYTDLVRMTPNGLVAGESRRFTPSGLSAGEDVWLFDGRQTIQLGLTGSQYERPWQGGTRRENTLEGLLDNGVAWGATGFRGGTYYGQDAWIYNGQTVRRIGLYDGEFSNHGSSTSAIQRATYIRGHDARSGITWGNSLINRASGSSTFRSAGWIDDGTSSYEVGLRGAGYDYINNGVTARTTLVQGVSPQGEVFGYSYRFDQAGTQRGIDTFVYVEGVIRRINPDGGAYEFGDFDGTSHRFAVVDNALGGGKYQGTSRRYDTNGDSLGEDDWIYDASTGQHTLLGLASQDYSYVAASGRVGRSTFSSLASNGRFYGTTKRYDAAGVDHGRDAWINNSSGAARRVGLIGDGYQYTTASGQVYRLAGSIAVINDGVAFGYTWRYGEVGTRLGQDAWYDNGNYTRLIGLVGEGYERQFAGTGNTTYRDNRFFTHASDERPWAVGYSQRYSETGSAIGRQAWVFDGQTTKAVGLTGGFFEYERDGATVLDALPRTTNRNGQLLGVSNRRSSNGQYLGESYWVYDFLTGQTHALVAPGRSDGYSRFGNVRLTDSGTVIGDYWAYEDDQHTGSRPFWWHPQAGFYDLAETAAAALDANGLTDLDGFVLDDYTFVNGGSPIINGLMPGQAEGTTPLYIVPAYNRLVRKPSLDAGASWNGSSFDLSPDDFTMAAQRVGFAGIDSRMLMAFSLDSGPDPEQLLAASLQLDVAFYTSSTNNGLAEYATLELYAYADDGTLEPVDLTGDLVRIGTSDNITSLGPIEIDLDTQALMTLLQEGTEYLGIVGLSGPSDRQVGVMTREAEAFGIGTAPILDLQYGVLGDLNGDAQTNHADISAFVMALIDQEAFESLHPGINPDLFGDFNDDGVMDNLDILGFISLLSEGNEQQSQAIATSIADEIAGVPEPTTLVLLGPGALVLLRGPRTPKNPITPS